MLGIGFPRLACLRPAAWLKWGPNAAQLHQLKLKTLARGQAPRGGRQGASSGAASSGRLARRRRDQGRVPPKEPVTQAMSIEGQAGAGLCSVLVSPSVQRGASTGQGIRQRLPFWCNKTKTSKTAGWRSSWSPGRRHHQSLWQPKTNFSQDKCTRCSPSKWPIVGTLPAHYLGRGPGTPSINRASHHRVEASSIYLKKTDRLERSD